MCLFKGIQDRVIRTEFKVKKRYTETSWFCDSLDERIVKFKNLGIINK